MKMKSLLIAATVSMLAITAARTQPAPGQTIVVTPGPTPPATVAPAPAPPPAVGAPPAGVTTTTTTTVTTTEPVHVWNNPSAWWNQTTSWGTPTEHHYLFNANEFTLDFFGYYRVPERTFTAFPNSSFQHGIFGGGLGANYFWSRDAGIGVDTGFPVDPHAAHFVDYVNGNLFLRFPIEFIHLAPYVFGGGGRWFNPVTSWFGDLGAGVEFRFNRNLGLFGDGRYIWAQREINGNGFKDLLLVRVGLRVAF